MPFWQNLYVFASLCIGLGIGIQSLWIAKSGNKLPNHRLFFILSTADSLWVLVSAAALYFIDFSFFANAVPVVFLIYTAAGWVHAVKNFGDDVASLEDVVFSVQYLQFCKAFCVLFCLLCACVLFFPDAPSYLLQVF